MSPFEVVGDIAVVPGEVRLAVGDTYERSSIGAVPAASGEMFVVVSLALANGLNVAVVASPAAFRVRTGDGLERLAAPNSALLADACPATAFLGPGQRLACSVAFALDRSAVPTALIYAGAAEATEPNSARLLRVEAPISDFRHCARCNDSCVELGSSERHCGQCGVAVPVGGRCADGVPTCPSGQTTCAGECVDLRTNPSHCGQCDRRYTGGVCVGGVPACPADETACAGECVNLLTNSSHCGRCDRRVPGGAQCRGGEIGCYYSGDALCGNRCIPTELDEANCGGCGQVCPAGFSCGGDYYFASWTGQCVNDDYYRAPDGESCDAECARHGSTCLYAEYRLSTGGGSDTDCSNTSSGQAPVYCICRFTFQ